MNLSTWLEEVRRRRVIRAMVGWGLFSFAALQVVEPVQHALGHPPASKRALDDLIARFSHSMPFQIAEVCAWRGDADCAFQWLDRADESRDIGVAFVTFSPFLASIRGDPRYKAFLRRLNLP